MNNKFNIKDKVYHITPDSPMGVILDVRHYLRDNIYEYLIVWSHTESSYAIEDELSKDKVFV